MAEHPVIMENKQLKVFVKPANDTGGHSRKESVVDEAPKVADGKLTVGQKLSKYAFGEEIAQPGKYIWQSYLEPTGKRVANDVVEHFLHLLLQTFQRWIWHGKTLDNGKWGDRTSFSNYSKNQEPVKAMVMMSPVKELTFPTRGAAERVLAELRDTIQEEGAVTVRQYYETSSVPNLCEAGISSSTGWTNLNKCEIREQPGGEGFMIALPRPVSLSSGK